MNDPRQEIDEVLKRIEELLTDRSEVMRLNRAVARLPMRDSAARRWLRREELVVDLDGRECVIWTDVLERLRRRPGMPRRPRRAPLPRISLD